MANYEQFALAELEASDEALRKVTEDPPIEDLDEFNAFILLSNLHVQRAQVYATLAIHVGHPYVDDDDI